MSKQIYIDSNGNEIQVSGTVNTADMMPMSGNDSTKVSEAIGDLSDLTTTDKSSIVGAVNEVNAQRVWTINLGEVGSAVTINTVTWTLFDTAKSITLPTGDYKFVIFLNAKWTGSSYTFKASLQLDGTNNVATNAYSQEQANSMCAFVGGLLVPSDGAHTLQLACSVSNTAKSIQIMPFTPVMCMIFKK